MLPRQPSHPPITLPTMAPCWIARRKPSPWVWTSRRSSSSVSVGLGMAPARSQRANTAGHSSKRQGLITIIEMTPGQPSLAPHRGRPYNPFSPPRGDSRAIKRDFTLDAKYRQEEGLILLSGIQALVRLPLDQHRADKRRGLNTATLISGYRGSPLGGLDLTLERNPALLREHNVVFLSGVNEDLGATAVYGSQLANLFPQPKYDGVLGMWYGKGPGVDRTGDIFKHANFAGVSRHGGVLALGGDDPLSKSSTIPSHSEVAFYDALFPVLFPGSAQEILDLGRLGFELSRYSGLWVGVKIVTNVADEIATAEARVATARVRPVRDPPPEDRDAVPDGAGHDPRVLPGSRGAPGGRGEARVLRALHPRHPLQPGGAPAGGGQIRRARAPARARRRRARRRPDRPDRGRARRTTDPSRVHHGAGGAPRGAAPAARAPDPDPAAVLLLGMPAQPVDRAAGGLDRQRRHRLPRDGALDGPQDDGAHAHGRRGRPVGGYGAVHRDQAPLPESRRRHLVSLRLAGDPPCCRVECQHHIQDPLQLGGGDDGRPGSRRGDAGDRADALARGRGRQARHRDDRRAGQVSEERGVGARRRGLAPRPARRGAATTPGHSRGHGARLRSAVRRGEAAAAQARPAPRPGNARRHQRGGMRRLRRLRREEQLPLGAPRRDRVRTEDSDPPVVL